MQKPELSIVVLSYNTKELLKDCLNSLEKVKDEVRFEVIVVDNASIDSSADMVKENFKEVKLIENNKNLGFAAGNNKAKSYCSGKYVLFLNSDTIVHKGTLKKMVEFMEENKEVGASTCKILLPDGSLDKDARRAFITPWIGLTHIYLKLDRLFPESKLFGKYWYGYISPDKKHEVDALQGAFFLVRRKVLDKVGWFDEDYFLDGEDIDLSWRIKKEGYKNFYYPEVSILHRKGASKGKVESATREKIPVHLKIRHRMAGVNSMEIFYKKHLWDKYPFVFNIFVLAGIKFLKAVRFTRTIFFG